jgi:response regulator NasT
MQQKKKQGYRIFIVEDEPLVLESYKSIVISNGNTIAGTATNGRDALLRIPISDVEIVLMDVNIPGLTGLEVIRQLSAINKIPCIFITGYYSQELVDAANSVGAFGYIVKPVDDKQLIAAIKIAMQQFDELQKTRDELDNMKIALQDRISIEKAKGILMKRRHVQEDEAMRLLQQKSRSQIKSL